MGVDSKGRLNVPMSRKILQTLCTHTAVVHPCNEGVPKGVRGDGRQLFGMCGISKKLLEKSSPVCRQMMKHIAMNEKP